jgi:hypothetical protein
MSLHNKKGAKQTTYTQEKQNDSTTCRTTWKKKDKKKRESDKHRIQK